MAVVDINSELAARNPHGAKNEVHKTLRAMDTHITMLGLAADSAALTEQDEKLIRALYMAYGGLVAEHGRLCQLL